MKQDNTPDDPRSEAAEEDEPATLEARRHYRDNDALQAAGNLAFLTVRPCVDTNEAAFTIAELAMERLLRDKSTRWEEATERDRGVRDAVRATATDLRAASEAVRRVGEKVD